MNVKKMLITAAAAALLLTGCSGPAVSESAPATADNSLQKVLDSGELKIGLDASFPPMGFTDEENNIIGFDIDVAQEVCDRMGIRLVKQPFIWEAMEEDLNTGRIDCVWNGMSITPARAEAMTLSEPYMENVVVLIVPTDSSITCFEDLTDKTVSVQAGTTAEEFLEASSGYPNIETSIVEDSIEAARQMEMGFTDAAFMDSVMADYLKVVKGKDFRIIDEGFAKEQYAIGFRKGDETLRDEIQQQLSAMKSDGTLAEISTRWFGSDITIVQ